MHIVVRHQAPNMFTDNIVVGGMKNIKRGGFGQRWDTLKHWNEARTEESTLYLSSSFRYVIPVDRSNPITGT